MATALIMLPVAVSSSIGCGDDADDASSAGSGGTAAAGASGSGANGSGAGGDGGAPPPTSLSCDDVECGASNGATVPVPAGTDLQAAIDAAMPGDVLLLDAGATYSGSFQLPEKSGDGCITIRTSTADADLPADLRVTPADAPKLARVVTPGGGLPAITALSRAHHYRLIGLEILPETADAEVYELVSLGTGEASPEELPHHLVIERSFVHGWAGKNLKRGIALNSGAACVIRSHVSDVHSDFQDSQAIGGYNGTGPFRIIDNRLEGAAENIMFGGAVPAIVGLVPTDIVVRGNHLYKPLTWKADDPSNDGYVPWVKNLFEIKNGRDVTLDGNVLENNWVGADQHGIAIVLTPRGEDGAAPWATVDNVRITNNIIRHVGGGVGILGRDTGGLSEQSKNILIANNVFEDLRQDYALDILRVFQFNEVAGVAIDHNTFQFGAGSWPFLRTFGEPTTGFSYTNNVVEYREGLWSECGQDAEALACILPGGVVAGNVLVGGPAGAFAATNHYPATLQDVGFVDYAGGAADYHGYALTPSSAYAGGGSDGANPGIDPAAIEAARGTTAAP
jgi:hypothetical protein